MTEWFCNLWLLQIKSKLRLFDTYYVEEEFGPFVVADIVAKVDALRAIVENVGLRQHNPPLLRKPSARRVFPNMTGLRVDAFCRNGLLAQ